MPPGALKVRTSTDPDVWTVIGGGSFATDAETIAGTIDDKAVTPAGLNAALDDIDYPYIDVRAYGAKVDGATDDTAEIQAAIDAGVADGSVVVFPPGGAIITAPLTITKRVTLRGSSQYGSRITAVGCSGIQVAAGVTNFRMENIEVAAAVRHTTTPNAYIGIDVAGSTGSRPFNHLYRDVYVDGFQTGFRSTYLWGTNFDNFRTNHCHIGMDLYGLTVNNFMSGCSILYPTPGVVGTRGIRFAGAESPTDATDVGTEAWHLVNTLIDNFEVGVEMIGITHCAIADCIIDHNSKSAILVDDNGTNFAGNLSIHDCYLAITGTVGVAAIDLQSSIVNTQAVGIRIHDNHIWTYAGATCTYGIFVADTSAAAVIIGNVIKGFATADIRTQRGGNIIIGNKLLSAIAINLYSTFLNEVAGNVGVVYWPGGSTPVAHTSVGRMKITYAAALPTTGTWLAGDLCYNTAPAVGQPIGWMCRVGGTPGTWNALANLA